MVDTGTRSRVALVRCPDYDPETVHEAVGRGLALLGGAERFVRPGERILLKPNLLVAGAPEAAITTHPAVFRAAARHLRAAGAILNYGDSPGFGRTAGVARRAGLVEVAEAEDIPLADFAGGRTISFPDGRLLKQFTIANGALEADGIVSLCKLKTHGLTRTTGAIKNQFGCIPGMLKGEFHVRMNTADRFSQMLVDLNRFLQPRLYLMDGVIAMEGNGPRNGDPRQMSVLLFSDDPVALDATVCRMIALDRALVPTITWGDAWDLGTATLIEYLGDPLESFHTPDFVVDRAPGSTTGEPGRFSHLTKNLVVPRPVIDPRRCTACGTCVRVCPVQPKAVDFAAGRPSVRPEGRATPPTHEYKRCIRCYCCQEMCPEHAIGIARPLLGRLIHR
jgi:uncharacterized protein (DUF362 family)/NAD-dependent dihydropyrimidine dehydrogenase PreA subunit